LHNDIRHAHAHVTLILTQVPKFNSKLT